MDKETMQLLVSADSMLSYLHNRGYIRYGEHGCPTKDEVFDLYRAIRSKYEKYAKENGISLTS